MKRGEGTFATDPQHAGCRGQIGVERAEIGLQRGKRRAVCGAVIGGEIGVIAAVAHQIDEGAERATLPVPVLHQFIVASGGAAALIFHGCVAHRVGQIIGRPACERRPVRQRALDQHGAAGRVEAMQEIVARQIFRRQQTGGVGRQGALPLHHVEQPFAAAQRADEVGRGSGGFGRILDRVETGLPQRHLHPHIDRREGAGGGRFGHIVPYRPIMTGLLQTMTIR